MLALIWYQPGSSAYAYLDGEDYSNVVLVRTVSVPFFSWCRCTTHGFCAASALLLAACTHCGVHRHGLHWYDTSLLLEIIYFPAAFVMVAQW